MQQVLTRRATEASPGRRPAWLCLSILRGLSSLNSSLPFKKIKSRCRGVSRIAQNSDSSISFPRLRKIKRSSLMPWARWRRDQNQLCKTIKRFMWRELPRELWGTAVITTIQAEICHLYNIRRLRVAWREEVLNRTASGSPSLRTFTVSAEMTFRAKRSDQVILEYTTNMEGTETLLQLIRCIITAREKDLAEATLVTILTSAHWWRARCPDFRRTPQINLSLGSARTPKEDCISLYGAASGFPYLEMLSPGCHRRRT